MSVALYAFSLISLASATETAGKQCKVYQAPIRGKALGGHTYKTAKVGELFRCYVRCERDPACKSCNFKHTQEICEMNNETKETKPNDFITDEQSYYIKRTGGDVDECTSFPNICGANADCHNTDGSYICNCKGGYTGDGVPTPIAFYPLNINSTIHDFAERPPYSALASNVEFTSGPANESNGAYQFKGATNSFIQFPNTGGILDVKYSITLMCWVRPGGQDGPLFNYKRQGAWGVHIWIYDNGKFYVQITKFGSHETLKYLRTDLPLQQGRWYHVAATYDSKTGVNSIYVDGVLSKTQKIGTGYRISTNDPAIRMGVKIGHSDLFNGAITQMGIYNVSLTGDQIRTVIERALKSRPCSSIPRKNGG
ncbi:sushi, von Willebrand factor type A, EGF and pentraxin domain-containing protein 1-like [Acropora millepora]|uniref:sushi, von Willebrand factor type A, EGF and pentraxin domain-containing protein 1-like n=1 Tax=Acropora millepora TaxID=45264 RepID=UPI001CF5DA50|nr:sushi, von Willebrand factor type A, EGF and pentraxin domain-containing protein 1-like [Acropora millepora]